jgi:ABC-type enterochelin transport system permease subunit|tara:strand:- start:7572 stop:7787 length:216 start_codon:yes stop_codon:yes gene_type:complete
VRTTGVFLALTGAAVIILFILYTVLETLVTVPFWIKVGLTLLIVGGGLLIVSLIKERRSDAEKEPYGGIEK